MKIKNMCKQPRAVLDTVVHISGKPPLYCSVYMKYIICCQQAMLPGKNRFYPEKTQPCQALLHLRCLCSVYILYAISTLIYHKY